LPVFTTNAAELFGIPLNSANHDDLSTAAKQAGVSLIREGGKAKWFDVFDSQTVLSGSSRLYLGYVKQDRRFAFAEYEFIGLKQSQMLAKLKRKYGKPQVLAGKYLSDKRYRWQQGGIEISLTTDWPGYRTRLSYIEPRAMTSLKKERQAANLAGQTSEQTTF